MSRSASASVAPAGFVATSTNADADGRPFVSTMESVAPARARVYAAQWHAEANEFDRDETYLDHTPDALRAMQWAADFFVGEARENDHRPPPGGAPVISRDFRLVPGENSDTYWIE